MSVSWNYYCLHFKGPISSCYSRRIDFCKDLKGEINLDIPNENLNVNKISNERNNKP